jgi:hypothetical protein
MHSPVHNKPVSGILRGTDNRTLHLGKTACRIAAGCDTMGAYWGMVQWQHTGLWSRGSWFESRCPGLAIMMNIDGSDLTLRIVSPHGSTLFGR